MKKAVFRVGDTLVLFTFSKTSNKKIAAPGDKIVQTFHFSREQFEVAQRKTTMQEFFGHDGKVCFDCPFSVSNGAKLSACYTHKMMQYTGFLSSLRSIGKEYGTFDAIPYLSPKLLDDIVQACTGKYVRFGSYGEPILVPFDMVQKICAVAKSWTGYTHQWLSYPEYSAYFMASTHAPCGEAMARALGWKSFVASPELLSGMVNCPASEEQNFRSNCAKCGLCSGTMGKGSKSVVILEH
jgi:hypothetical protein